MSNTDLATSNRKDSNSSSSRAATPAVDVFEDANGITLLAHMPGVSRENLVKPEKKTNQDKVMT